MRSEAASSEAATGYDTGLYAARTSPLAATGHQRFGRSAANPYRTPHNGAADAATTDTGKAASA
jgi:hypothetical protein